jgi:hypothetical protein
LCTRFVHPGNDQPHGMVRPSVLQTARHMSFTRVLRFRADWWCAHLGPHAHRFVLRPFWRGRRTLWAAKSSSFAPAFNFSRSQIGCLPLPAHALPDLSRYLTASFRFFKELLLPSLLEPISSPSLESWCFNSLALRPRTFSMSSRSLRSASTDIEARLPFGISTSNKLPTQLIATAENELIVRSGSVLISHWLWRQARLHPRQAH